MESLCVVDRLQELLAQLLLIHAAHARARNGTQGRKHPQASKHKEVGDQS